MPTSIDVHLRMMANGLVLIEQSWAGTVTAIDDISIDLSDAAVDEQIDIQPGPASDISFIGIVNVGGIADISYRSSITGPSIPLAAAHAYSGPGMAALLGANPTSLFFTNASGAVAAIKIVVARQT